MEVNWKNPRVLWRYALFQLPGVFLVIAIGATVERLGVLDRSTWLLGLLIWTLKDFALYPLVWQSYIPSGMINSDTLVGLICKATTNLNPYGMVRVKGEMWQAVVDETVYASEVLAGSDMKIVAQKGMKLTVIPLDFETSPGKDSPALE